MLIAQSCLTLCDPMTAACQASLSMRFPRQEYCSELLFLSQDDGDHLDPGTEPRSPALALSMDSLPSEPPGKPSTAGFASNCSLYAT